MLNTRATHQALTAPQGPQFRRATPHKEVLQLLEHRVLQHRVHDEEQRGPDPAPERAKPALAHDEPGSLEKAQVS